MNHVIQAARSLSLGLLLAAGLLVAGVPAAYAADPVDINTATAAEIDAALVNVGPAKAEAIVDAYHATTVARGNINDNSITDYSAAFGNNYQYRVVAWNLVDTAPDLSLAGYFTTEQTMSGKADLVTRFREAVGVTHEWRITGGRVSVGAR